MTILSDPFWSYSCKVFINPWLSKIRVWALLVKLKFKKSAPHTRHAYLKKIFFLSLLPFKNKSQFIISRSFVIIVVILFYCYYKIFCILKCFPCPYDLVYVTQTNSFIAFLAWLIINYAKFHLKADVATHHEIPKRIQNSLIGKLLSDWHSFKDSFCTFIF